MDLAPLVETGRGDPVDTIDMVQAQVLTASVSEVALQSRIAAALNDLRIDVAAQSEAARRYDLNARIDLLKFNKDAERRLLADLPTQLDQLEQLYVTWVDQVRALRRRYNAAAIPTWQWMVSEAPEMPRQIAREPDLYAFACALFGAMGGCDSARARVQHWRRRFGSY
jgi:hypothetical protein